MEESHNEDNTGSLSVNKTESVIYSTVNMENIIDNQNNSRSHHASRPLIIVLIILGAAIVGLAVGIIIINLSSHKPSGTVDATDNETTSEDILSEIREHTRTISAGESQTYINDMIEKYAGADEEFSIRLIKVNLLKNENQYTEALIEAKKLEQQELNDIEEMQLYSTFREIYIELANASDDENEGKDYLNEYNEYNNKYWNLYLDYYEGGEGA